MSTSLRLLPCLLVCALFFAGCGDDAPTDDNNPLGMGTPENPLGAGTPGNPFGGEAVRLTDADMQAYFDLMKDMQESGGDPMSLLAKHKLNQRRWLALVRASQSAGRGQVEEELDKQRKKIADLQAQIDAGTGNTERLQQQLAGEQQALKMIESLGAQLGTATDVDRHNAALFAKWRERFEAIGDE